MAAKRKPEPVRKRLTIPAADVSVIQWLEAQDDESGSMRKLIRDSIERDGYTDVLNRPVEQLPRRGRPPKDDFDFSEPQVSSSNGAPLNTASERSGDAGDAGFDPEDLQDSVRVDESDLETFEDSYLSTKAGEPVAAQLDDESAIEPEAQPAQADQPAQPPKATKQSAERAAQQPAQPAQAEQPTQAEPAPEQKKPKVESGIGAGMGSFLTS